MFLVWCAYTLKKRKVIKLTDFNKDWVISTFKSGRTNSITGDKGGGKSHFAVWMMRILTLIGFKVYTNILFKQCIGFEKGGRPIYEENYPDSVEKVESLVDLIKKVCVNLLDNPYQPSVFFWDELQNSLSAYDWNTVLFRVIIKFLSITRKFGLDHPADILEGGLCIVVMSPSFYRGIPKGIREELDHAFFKDEELYDMFMSYFPDGKQFHVKEIVFYKKGKRSILNDKSIGEVMKVGTCPWCDTRSIGKNDIVYAQKGFSHLKLGTFDNGREMKLEDFESFLDYTSKVIPDRLPEKALKYLKGTMHKCEVCGTETTNPKYCSESCNDKAYYKRKTERKPK